MKRMDKTMARARKERRLRRLLATEFVPEGCCHTVTISLSEPIPPKEEILAGVSTLIKRMKMIEARGGK